MIEIKALSKYYSLNRQQQYALGADSTQLKALDNISFQVEKGEVLLVLGTKNSGKSTLLQVIAAMLSFEKGSVSVMGLDAAKEGRAIRKKMAMISSRPAFYEYLTVKEHLEYFARLNGVAAGVSKERIPKLLQEWKLEAVKKMTIRRLSDVERRYFSIAQSLINDPELLLLDEPTLGLDIFTAQPFVELVDYAKENGKTVIFSTNNISKAELLGDRVIVLDKGRVIHESPMSAFKKLAGGNNAKAFLDIIANEGGAV